MFDGVVVLATPMDLRVLAGRRSEGVVLYIHIHTCIYVYVHVGIYGGDAVRNTRKFDGSLCILF